MKCIKPETECRFRDKKGLCHWDCPYDEPGSDCPDAVGTVCKTNDLGFIEYCYQIARRFFPHSWIHAFGLTLSALPKVSRYINSWDSMAWTFPRKPGHSCKNSRERVRYFIEYLERVNEKEA